MKSLLKFAGAILILGLVFAFGMSTGNEIFAGSVTVAVGAFSAIMHTSPSMQGKLFNTVTIPDFTEKSQEDIDAMSPADYAKYKTEERDFHSKTLEHKLQGQLDAINKKIEAGENVTKDVDALEAKMQKLIDEQAANGVRLKKIAENSKGTKGAAELKGISETLAAKGAEFKKFLDAGKGKFMIEVNLTDKALTAKDSLLKEVREAAKASQAAGDIDSGTDFAQMLPGVGQIPRKRTYIKDRIRTISTNTEYIKYLDQETVVRDAKNVAGCGVATHTTKLTWKTYTLQQTKVRDFVDVCIDMMEDYDFVEGEIRNLIDSSVQLKIDNGLLLDDGIHPNLKSIDSTSSTFNAAAVGADYAAEVQAATLIDLIMVGSAQIKAFGQENSWIGDTCYLNPKDLTLLKLLKDQDDNYIKGNSIAPRVIQNANGNLVVDGVVELISNPNVAENEMYIFDSMQAAIYQAKTAVIEFSFENRSNFETETVTVKAYERLNMLVRNVNANAFLHFPDIAAGITAITAP